MAKGWLSWPRRRSADAVPDERKNGRLGAVLAFPGGRAMWSGDGYAELARAGYMGNPIVFRAVRIVAEAVGQVPWIIKEGVHDIEQHPFLDLMRRPNGRDGFSAFLETVASHLLVAGNAYLDRIVLDRTPCEVHVLRPDRMRIVVGDDGWPIGYDYGAGGRTIRRPAVGPDGEAPILHIRSFHPLDDHYGLAPIAASAMSLDIHNAAATWNKALLDNAARPSGALVYTGAHGLSDDQFERLKRELESGFQGAENAGRPLVLEGGLDWKSMALTPKEMDFTEARNMAAREIALVFGVPPMLLGIPGDATYANYQEANRALWRQTVLPLARRIADAIGTWLLPAWGGDLHVDLDLDQIPSLQSERDGLWARVQAADFLSRDEKRAAVGYGPSETDGTTGEGGKAA
jgi:HK97 family phage portal protein